MRFNPGESWFLDRVSAMPELKWQVAQAVMPSLPTCMSQNRALPSRIAAWRSCTKSPRLVGSGTGTVFKEGGRGGSPGAGTCERTEPVTESTPSTTPMPTRSVNLLIVVSSKL